MHLKDLVKVIFSLILFHQNCFAQNLPVLEKHICYKTREQIKIDGVLNEYSWLEADYSSFFVDIEGPKKPKPLYETRVKMLWDDEYFYIGAWLEEPHLWATIKERDAVIFHDNDFEIFIDPNGDTHNYVEIEINALNTVWDLILTKPYRDRGRVLNSWNMEGLITAVNLSGTINNPSDIDSCWTIEFALPWQSLIEFTDRKKPPVDEDQWRINFSRVQWQLEVKDDKYHKKINPSTNKPYPEYNWVWSPQGVINMHQPETWGVVQFSEIEVGKGAVDFLMDLNENCKWELRKLYYAQRGYFSDFGKYTLDLDELKKHSNKTLDDLIEIQLDHNSYIGIIKCHDSGKQWQIQADGLVWSE